jgi:hypothetical protein
MAAKRPKATAQDLLKRRGRRAQPPGTGKRKRGLPVPTTPMTPAQEAFIAHWLVRRNATRAYQDAYPEASYSTASSEGSRLFHDPRISQEIKAALAEERKHLAQDGKRVIAELSALAFCNLADVYTTTGTMVAPTDLPRYVAAAIKKVKRREIVEKTLDAESGEVVERVVGHTIELEMQDKGKALHALAVHHGLLVEQIEVGKVGDFARRIQEGRERALKAAIAAKANKR